MYVFLGPRMARRAVDGRVFLRIMKGNLKIGFNGMLWNFLPCRLLKTGKAISQPLLSLIYLEVKAE